MVRQMKAAASCLCLGMVLICTPRADAESGGFDLAAVEELALFYATESMRRLRIPLVLRLISIGQDTPSRKEMIAEIEADPPKADENGVVYPFGENNDLAFVFDPGTQSMLVSYRMYKTRGEMSLWGVTAHEHAVLLNDASTEKERGGALFSYEPLRDVLALLKRYDQAWETRKRFYKEIERLRKVHDWWFQERFADRSNKLIAALEPPPSASAIEDGFEATLLLRHFDVHTTHSPVLVQRFLDGWQRPDGYREPRLVSHSELFEERKMYAFVLFRGATNDQNGIAFVGASFRLIAPDGSVRLDNMRPLLWNSAARPRDHRQVGMNNVSFTMTDEAPGTYRVEAEVCEVASSRCVEVMHPFEFSGKIPDE